MYVSRHVKFVDDVFPFPAFSPTSTPASLSDVDEWCTVVLPIVEPPIVQPNVEPQSPILSSPILPSNSLQSSPTTPTTSMTSSPTPLPPPPPPARTIVTRLQNNFVKPNPKFANLTTTRVQSLEPQNTTQALKDPQWRRAMTEEYDALVHNVTWELVPSHPSQNVVGNKWVYRIKYKPTGEIERYKARLVAKGFHQRPGIDYSKTFSLVIKPTTVRLMLSLAVTNGWNIRQLDINSAFLQGHLNEDVFMAQPLEFLDKDNPTHVCKLHKAIYGLKQALRTWYQELRTYLLSYGFSNSIANSSLFIYKNNNVTFYLLVYVDDIIIMGPSSSALQVFVTSLASRFSLKDLGSLSYFLGVEVLPHEHGLFLSQKKYIQDLLDRAKMSNAKPVPTPMATYPPLNLTDGSPLFNPTDYRALIGTFNIYH